MLLAGALTLSACTGMDTTVNDRNEYLAVQTRLYKGEGRERLLQAAEAVVRASGNYEFEFGLNGFSARKSYFVYGIVANASGREKWDFNTEANPGGLLATATVSDAGDIHGGLTVSRYEKIGVAAPVYELFWARVDYVLGRRADWLSCAQAQAEKGAGGSLYGLCGGLSGSEAIPPQLAPVTPRAGRRSGQAARP
ncbi:MAG: hypothetical protein Q7T81_15040 [Pseudolabrys sp.]|nr:hypothetical protein [Pseudolabrys sp.]